jgi:hypothetical protein
MGLGVWYFLRLAPGELRPVAGAQRDRFFRREATQPSHQGIARYVELIVQMEARKAVEVVRFGGFQYRVDAADAELDPQHLGEVMAVAGQVVLGGALPTDLVPGVVAAEHRRVVPASPVSAAREGVRRLRNAR